MTAAEAVSIAFPITAELQGAGWAIFGHDAAPFRSERAFTARLSYRLVYVLMGHVRSANKYKRPPHSIRDLLKDLPDSGAPGS